MCTGRAAPHPCEIRGLTLLIAGRLTDSPSGVGILAAVSASVLFEVMLLVAGGELLTGGLRGDQVAAAMAAPRGGCAGCSRNGESCTTT